MPFFCFAAKELPGADDSPAILRLAQGAKFWREP
jgi:hypothetical protein